MGKAKAAAMPFVLSQTIPYPDTAADMMLDLMVRRCIEMEINAAGRHVARLRSVAISRAGRERVLRFRGIVTPDGAWQDLTLEARPSRQFRGWDHETTVATYGALPFQLLSANFSPAR